VSGNVGFIWLTKGAVANSCVCVCVCACVRARARAVMNFPVP